MFTSAKYYVINSIYHILRVSRDKIIACASKTWVIRVNRLEANTVYYNISFTVDVYVMDI